MILQPTTLDKEIFSFFFPLGFIYTPLVNVLKRAGENEHPFVELSQHLSSFLYTLQIFCLTVTNF